MQFFVFLPLKTNRAEVNSVVKREAVSNCEPGSFSSLVCLFGLSSAIGTPVKSIYSPRKITKLFPLFTQTFCPQEGSTKDTIHLLWSTTEELESYTKSNHFTVCVDIQSHKAITGMTSISLLAKCMMEPLGKRKRQTTLDFLSLKKILLLLTPPPRHHILLLLVQLLLLFLFWSRKTSLLM